VENEHRFRDKGVKISGKIVGGSAGGTAQIEIFSFCADF
jgi:hypothetical protein